MTTTIVLGMLDTRYSLSDAALDALDFLDARDSEDEDCALTLRCPTFGGAS